MKSKSANLLGSYGSWASDLIPESPGPLSFRNNARSDLSEWKEEARGKVLELIFKPPIEKKVNAHLVKKYKYEDLEVEEIAWSLPYGPETRAFFLKPGGAGRSGKLPGILALHDHGGIKYFGKQKITRTSEPQHPFIKAHQEKYYGGLAWANELAGRGYGVLVHDVFPFGSRKILASDMQAHAVERIMKAPLDLKEIEPEDLDIDGIIEIYDVPMEEPDDRIRLYNAFASQHEHIIARSLFSAGLTWPGIFVTEDIFALDYLCFRPDIDADRIGCCGLSGGGLRTNYLAGLDDRIRCSVTAGFMTTWRDFVLNISFNHSWMIYIPHLPRYMEFPEILGLRVPLPALVLAANQDPLFTLKEVKIAGRILNELYKKVNAPDNFKISYYDGPHRFDPAMQEEAFAWFDLRLSDCNIRK